MGADDFISKPFDINEVLARVESQLRRYKAFSSSKTNSNNKLTHKNLTLDISKYMYDRFKELGVPVKMTRTSDVDLDANARPKVVLDQYGNGKDVIVLSNHINAGGGDSQSVTNV